MPWWLRLVLLGLRAPVERFAVRLFAVLAGFVAVSFVTLILLALGSALLAPLRERRLDRRWEQTLAAPESIRAAYPPRGANSSALALEQAATRFGLDIVPQRAVRRSVEVADPLPCLPMLRRWSAEVVAGAANGLVRPPDAVRRVLGERRAALDELVDGILSGDTPRWERRLGGDDQGSVPKLAALTVLQRWLAAAAAESLAAGDEAAAAQVLDASWKLNMEALQRPEMSSRLEAWTVLRLQLALLRQLPTPAAHWQQRLVELDPVAVFFEAVLVESCAARAEVNRGRLIDPESGWGVARSTLVTPLARWLMVDGMEAQRRGVEQLATADVGSFDPDAFFVDLHEQIPRWNVLARATLANYWSGWPQAVRLALGTELTVAVMRMRATGKEGWQKLVPRLPIVEPARVPPGSWEWSNVKGGARVRLVGVLLRPAPGPGLTELPLEQVVSWR